jgi:DNA-binding winged helix-turn-helix (wHTH) protein
MSTSQEVLPRDAALVFEAFRLDRRNGLFRRPEGGSWEPIALGSRALAVLWILAERRGELVTQRALMDERISKRGQPAGGGGQANERFPAH